jgi:DNA helicase-2/ATP-dependent DNA helicase PcrA
MATTSPHHVHQLNQEQEEAVKHLSGPLLVLAGAGSGKTRVVTLRIAELILAGIPPEEILGMTFTNKAAQEMRQRVESQTKAKVLISTFHSLGARILRESIHYLGYKNDFTIYDGEDQEKVVKGILKEKGLGEKKGEARGFISFISNAKNSLLSLDTPPKDREEELYFDVYKAYQRRLGDAQAVDFDDLLYLPVRLFREMPEVLNNYQNRWKYLLIDEYQDTNEAQYIMVKLLVEKHRNICVVGDPDQSIYSWRGANLRNILDFNRDYADAKVIRLEQNYRSVTNILDAANALITYNDDRIEKNLWSALGAGEKIKLFAADDERREADFVAREIEKNLNEGYSLDEIVIFYRTNAQSRVLEDRLLYRRIPYQIIGGLSFYQRREIKDLLAYLRLVHSGSDFLSFERALLVPKRGVGEATLDKIRLEANRLRLPIFSAVQEIISGRTELKLGPKILDELKRFVSFIEELRKIPQLSDLVRTTIEGSGYIGYLREEAETFEDRRENVEALLVKAMEWEGEREGGTLSQFLEELSLKGQIDDLGGQGPTLSMMTIHNGKGLEFPVVFLVGMEETLFPHINSLGKKEAVEEERRLCYVGMTRAKKRLYLSSSRGRTLWGGFRPMTPSRFLREIPAIFLEKIR